jgi:quercetin 2,3-dioxygenase
VADDNSPDNTNQMKTVKTSIKHIEKIISPPPPHWVGDGFKVHTFFPGNGLEMERMSPFFLMDYNSRMHVPASLVQRGVGVHPHRGFETVTIVYKGSVAHHDSFGNSGVIHAGDVQWMTAGSGLLHKEYHEKSFSERGGEFQVVQLWVNLPAKHKMTNPKYQGIVNASMGRFKLPGNSGVVEVLAGEFQGVSGPAETFTPLQIYNARLNNKANLALSFPENYNTAILVVEGNVRINDSEPIPTDRLILFENGGSDISISAIDPCVLLVLSGEPIGETISAYGPFVMNTVEEIEQAFLDMKAGKFGILADN